MKFDAIVPTPLRRRFCVCLLLCVAALCARADRVAPCARTTTPEAADTADRGGQGAGDGDQAGTVRCVSRPVAASVVGSARRSGGSGVAGAEGALADAFPISTSPDYGSRMTSSIYVRGLGRTHRPAGDRPQHRQRPLPLRRTTTTSDLADIERIEVLRGPAERRFTAATRWAA